MGMRYLLLLFCLSWIAGTAAAQGVPRAKDGHPDLTGVWNPDGQYAGDFAKALKPGDKISLLASAAKIMKDRKKTADPANRCLPMGVPRLSAYPQKFVQTRTQIIILDEGDIHTFRTIYLGDGSIPRT